jgi:hypothetical protein
VHYIEFGVIVVTTSLGLAVMTGKYLAWRWSMNRVHIIDPRERLDWVSCN